MGTKNTDRTLPPLENTSEETPEKTLEKTPGTKSEINLAEKVSPEGEPQGVEPKEKGSGCAIHAPGCGCRSCACFSCLGLLLILAVFAAILYFRPPFVWNGIKSYLNAGYSPKTYDTQSSKDVIEDISADIEDDNTSTIDEAQLQSLVSNTLTEDGVRVDVEPSYLKIVTDIDTNKDHPLWVMIEFGQTSDDKLKITKVGFERVGAPGFLRNAISDAIFEALEVKPGEQADTSTELMKVLLDSDDSGISVEKVRFDKDKITIESEK